MARDLNVKNLTTGYGNSTVLQDVSLTVEPGSICAVLGRNGVGKTTLINSLAGHLPMRTGRILVDQKDITNLPAYKRASLGISLAPQGRRLFPSLSVKEHLDLAARPNSLLRVPWDLESVLASFPRLSERLGNLGSELSGGEQSMVAIARLLISNPAIALFDEPSEGLSPLLVQNVARVLTRAREGGMTIVIVEQNFGLIMDIADHVHLMSKGRIVYSGTPSRLSADPETRRVHLGG